MLLYRILRLIVDQTKLIPPNDALARLIDQSTASGELDESTLEQVFAARLEARRPEDDTRPRQE